MGIKHFFTWFKKHNKLRTTVSQTPPKNGCDHVLIDMNGIIHEAAQFVFKYGKYEPVIKLPPYLQKKVKQPTEQELYRRIREKVNEIMLILKPRKSVFLAIDGVAPKSKQNQQRQRRFRAAAEHPADSSFESNCITAGTDFMKRLSWFLTENIKEWIAVDPHVKVEVSPDSTPGEGEHKLINWINSHKHQSENEGESESDDVYCVVGLDADLILLCMMANKANIFIMREMTLGGGPEGPNARVDYIDINRARQFLPVPLDDLIILSCFIGNDFLPPIPSLEIRESLPEIGALDYFVKFYSENPNTRLVNRNTGFLNMRAMSKLFQAVALREQDIMDARSKDATRFANYLWTGNIEEYRHSYHDVKLKSSDKADIVSKYMQTVEWVYLYYSKHLVSSVSWSWYYPYNYTLHADDFVKYMPLNIKRFYFPKSEPSHPHEQLLRVIPPKNKYLIPRYLHDIYDRLIASKSAVEIDKAGKREEWEAVTIVDFVNPENIEYRSESCRCCEEQLAHPYSGTCKSCLVEAWHNRRD